MIFNNEGHSTDAILYVFERKKKKFKITPSLKWSIITFVPACSKISKTF